MVDKVHRQYCLWQYSYDNASRGDGIAWTFFCEHQYNYDLYISSKELQSAHGTVIFPIAVS